MLEFGPYGLLLVELVENVHDDYVGVPHLLPGMGRTLESRIVGLEGIQSLHLQVAGEGLVEVDGGIPEIEDVITIDDEGVLRSMPLGIVRMQLQSALSCPGWEKYGFMVVSE